MAAGARRDRDDPVRALLDRLAREAVVDDVVQRDPAPASAPPGSTSTRAPSEVITIGTFHLAQVAISSCSRALERWTIWLTA